MKALAVKTVGEVILVAIVVLVSVVILLGPGMDYVKKILQDLGLLPKPTEFENAIACAYWRCVEGCDSMRIKDIKVGEGECAKYWCKNILANINKFDPEFKENKICGWYANQYPIEVELKASRMKKDNIKEIAHCVVSDTTTGGINWLEVAQRGIPLWNIIKAIGNLWGEVKILFIKEDLISAKETETCSQGAIDLINAIKSVEVSGMTYISTLDASFCYAWGVAGCKPIYYTSVENQPRYITLSQNEEKQVQLVKNNWHRIKVDVGNIFLKPLTKWIETGIEGALPVEVFDKIVIKCSEDASKINVEEKECKEGKWLCDDKFYVKCVDVADINQLWFSISYGIPRPGVTLFEHTEYRGKYFPVYEDNPDLEKTPVGFESSSIQLPEGWKAVLYEEKNFEGKNITIAGNSSYLVHCKDGWWPPMGCPAYPSSIKFDKVGCTATIYTEEEYKGKEGFIDRNVNLTEIKGPCNGNWNDCIKSIKVKEGCTVTLYEAVNFAGHNITLSGNSSNILFDNKAKSIKIIKPLPLTS